VIDDEAKYRAVQSRDRRFDGVFFLGVRTTGIYCRPSCPARTPHRKNVSFFASAAAAQAGGFRACRRCLPDATPGSPEWDVRADLSGRAMRLISDGVVEREGVGGLATRLGYSERQVERTLTAELGAGPLALARARRAQTARTLIESTGMSFADVAFASGFSSIRQFNSTMREVYDATPSRLRGRRSDADPGSIRLRIGVRGPYAGTELVAFLAARTISGVEVADGPTYSRTLRLPHGYGAVTLTVPGSVPAGEVGFVECLLHLQDMRDLSVAIERSRRLLDADADPLAIDEALKRGAASIVMVGGMGGQTDHVMGHLGLLIRLALGGTAALISTGTEEAWPLIPGERAIDLPPGTRLSIFGFDDLTGLTLEGVDWPLTARDVPLGSTLTLSNVARGPVRIALDEGHGAIFAYPPGAAGSSAILPPSA